MEGRPPAHILRSRVCALFKEELDESVVLVLDRTMQGGLLGVPVHDLHATGRGLCEYGFEEGIAILSGSGVKDHFGTILGEETGDENAIGMGEDMARGIFIACYGGPEEGCYSVRSGARDIEEEGLEEVGEASIGEKKGGDIQSSLEVGGDQE